MRAGGTTLPPPSRLPRLEDAAPLLETVVNCIRTRQSRSSSHGRRKLERRTTSSPFFGRRLQRVAATRCARARKSISSQQLIRRSLLKCVSLSCANTVAMENEMSTKDVRRPRHGRRRASTAVLFLASEEEPHVDATVLRYRHRVCVFPCVLRRLRSYSAALMYFWETRIFFFHARSPGFLETIRDEI